MIEYVSSTIDHIRRELSKIVVGQDEPIEQILIALLAEGHALIEGVPGTAKTLTVKTLARIINANFGRIQFPRFRLRTPVRHLMSSLSTGH